MGRYAAVDEDRLRIATHEAGHVATLWMLGNADDIDHVDMQGDETSRAFVYRLFYRPHAIEQIEQEKRWTRGVLTNRVVRVARAEAMYLLAGDAATAALDENDGWFEAKAGGIVYEGDFGRAYDVAFALYADYDSALEFLQETAEWADEALAHPQLSRVVSSVASVLARVNVWITGKRVLRIIREAWPTDDDPPYREMGEIWSGRFEGQS